MKWAKTATRRTEWGGEVLELKAELLQEQEEEGGDWWHQPAGDVRIEEDELPRDQVIEGARACRIFPVSSNMVHPRRQRTASSWLWR
jgi:hypothetical protein